jgi:PST family polysaccharide transporter
VKPFDQDGKFAPSGEASEGSLRRLVVRGASVTLLSGGLGLAIQVLSTVVLGRLLMPEDFGLVAMVTTFSLLLVSFGENGLPEAIVQRDDIDHKLASNLFWLNVGCGVVLTLCFAASGPLLARFYHSPRLPAITLGISLSIFSTSTSVVHQALLKRAMRFTEVSFNNVFARLASVLVTIVLAVLGAGYWSLVAGAVALPLTQSIGAWLLCCWIPGLPGKHPATASTVRFALHTYGRFGINYATRNTDNLLVGWRFNAVSLGFYKKAYDLFALSATQFVHSLTIVVVSALNRVERNSDTYRTHLLNALGLMAFFGMGLAADLTLIGKDLIRVLLGPGWEPAGRIFSYFGPGVGMMMLYHTHGWIHLSSGRADRWFRWGFVEFGTTCAMFLIALRWGPIGIALAWTASFWILTFPALWYAGHPTGFRITPVIVSSLRYAVASLLAGSFTYWCLTQTSMLMRASGVGGAMARIAFVSIVLLVAYGAATVLTHGSVRPITQVIRILRDLRPGAKGRNDAKSEAAEDVIEATV